ncbi:MAG: beta-N-acetylhexosaminidase [Gemmatimonadaceae bacterium]
MKTRSLSALALMCVMGACRSPGTSAAPAPSDATPRISIIPAPVSLQVPREAAFSLDSSTRIVVASTVDTVMRVGQALATQLRPATGFPFPVTSDPGSPQGAITLALIAPRADLGEEGYSLVVTPTTVRLEAPTAAGLFRGVQTIRQLLPFGIEAENSQIKMGDWKIPAVRIIDRPRFAYRSAMLDVSRHFFTVDEVKQYIDILALYKFNVFHIHLSDDQGWRIEIKSRPALVAMGSEMQVGGGQGGFYTQAEYSDIVRYAADRFITVVPEIDMPAHTNAMLISHPEVSCGKRPPAVFTGIEVGFSALCPDKEETYRLVDDIIREIAALTPGPFFHIGGDEVEALTREQYISFVERVQQIVTNHGKRMIGWEEITKARLLPTTIAQQWNSDSARNAMRSGAKVLMSPGPKVYLDMKYSTATELGLAWAGRNEIRVSYDWDPATYIAGLAETDIVGVEGPLWAETIRNMTAAQYLAMPRLPSIAEVGWTPQSARNWDEFKVRLARHAPRWRLLGINYYASPQIPW